MSGKLDPDRLLSRIGSAVVLLVSVAIGARIVLEVLAPVVPVALVVLALGWLYKKFLGRNRHL